MPHEQKPERPSQLESQERKEQRVRAAEFEKQNRPQMLHEQKPERPSQRESQENPIPELIVGTITTITTIATVGIGFNTNGTLWRTIRHAF
jgi:hypothetical protein